MGKDRPLSSNISLKHNYFTSYQTTVNSVNTGRSNESLKIMKGDVHRRTDHEGPDGSRDTTLLFL